MGWGWSFHDKGEWGRLPVLSGVQHWGRGNTHVCGGSSAEALPYRNRSAASSISEGAVSNAERLGNRPAKVWGKAQQGARSETSGRWQDTCRSPSPRPLAFCDGAFDDGFELEVTRRVCSSAILLRRHYRSVADKLGPRSVGRAASYTRDW